jgi:hypothetical protein
MLDASLQAEADTEPVTHIVYSLRVCGTNPTRRWHYLVNGFDCIVSLVHVVPVCRAPVV